MTDKEFASLCAEYPDLHFETEAEGELVVTPLPFTDISVFTLNVAVKLGIWAEKDGRGFCSDSQALFVLPNGARRAPDAAWTLKSRIKQLGNRRKKSIEIKSDSDPGGQPPKTFQRHHNRRRRPRRRLPPRPNQSLGPSRRSSLAPPCPATRPSRKVLRPAGRPFPSLTLVRQLNKRE